MTEDEAVQILRNEGFTDVNVWEDKPDHVYPDHAHKGKVAHVILRGRMYLTENGATKELRAGDRHDIHAGTVHAARMGPEGCRYVVGE